jgi:hypothetical protein
MEGPGSNVLQGDSGGSLRARFRLHGAAFMISCLI